MAFSVAYVMRACLCYWRGCGLSGARPFVVVVVCRFASLLVMQEFSFCFLIRVSGTSETMCVRVWLCCSR